MQVKLEEQKSPNPSLEFPVEISPQKSKRVEWIAHHGLDIDKYQDRFYELSDKGYRLTVTCSYEVNDQVKHAGIWIKKEGPPWCAYSGMTSIRYQNRFNDLVDEGYRLALVNGYSVKGEDRYTAIWVKESGPKWITYHNLTSSQYQDKFDELVNSGYRLVHVSGYSVRGEDRYAAIWTKETGPKWAAYHNLTSEQLRSRYDELHDQWYHLTCICGYEVEGQARYAGIWIKKGGRGWYAYSSLTMDQYQNKFETLANRGFRPTYINGYVINNEEKYATIWARNRLG